MYKYSTSVLAGNGKIYAAPLSPNKVLEIDPTGNKVTTKLIGQDLNIGADKYRTSVLAGNGKIYCASCGYNGSANFVLEITPSTDKTEATTKLIGQDLGDDKWKYSTSVLAGNGKIYAAPYDARYVLEIDPYYEDIKNATKLIDMELLGAFKYSTSVLARNGKIYAAPYGYEDSPNPGS